MVTMNTTFEAKGYFCIVQKKPQDRKVHGFSLPSLRISIKTKIIMWNESKENTCSFIIVNANLMQSYIFFLLSGYFSSITEVLQTQQQPLGELTFCHLSFRVTMGNIVKINFNSFLFHLILIGIFSSVKSIEFQLDSKCLFHRFVVLD